MELSRLVQIEVSMLFIGLQVTHLIIALPCLDIHNESAGMLHKI
jgi:hypothetical protein